MPLQIPYASLDESILNRLLSEIISREGTDYGQEEQTAEQKLMQIKQLLKSKKVALYWDEETETASLDALS